MLLLLLFGCTGAVAEPGLPAACDASEAALAVTWKNWSEGFFLSYCEGCHAQETPNTYGAPAGVHFGTEDEARAIEDRVRVRVLDEQTMPPAGGVLADDLLLLEAWLDCDSP